jgi:trigger factor
MSADESQSVAVDEAADEKSRLSMSVSIKDLGACRKHISVTVPEVDIKSIQTDALDELSDKAQVPGFRVGHVPVSLLLKKFRKEIDADIKQKVLLASLEQLSDEYKIEPIGQPRIDVEGLEVPEAGDFHYEFEVEVRPEFEIPDYSGITITRSPGEITDEEFQQFRDRFMSSYSDRETVDRPAEPGDYVICRMTFSHEGRVIRESSGQSLRVLPQLHFQDAVLHGFDKLMIGASAGDVREAKIRISLQSPIVEMRGEQVDGTFSVEEVQRQVLPEINEEFCSRLGADSEDGLNEMLRNAISRQNEFDQRQETRRQVLAAITASADWELPESLVREQAENALRREVLEMAQAGFTREDIASRENQIRQNVLESTRQALKEHFILDRIATKENIECEQSDIDRELALMSFQSGEPVRRIRARMVKNGMIENLEAQLRERKAVDFILSHVQFKDVPRKPPEAVESASVRFAICGNMTSSLVDDTGSNSDSE